MIEIWQTVFTILLSLLVFVAISLVLIKLWFYGIIPLVIYTFGDFFEVEEKTEKSQTDKFEYRSLRDQFFERTEILPPDIETAMIAFIVCLTASFFWPLFFLAGVCSLIHTKVEGRKKQLQLTKTQEERIKALEDLLSKATRHE